MTAVSGTVTMAGSMNPAPLSFLASPLACRCMSFVLSCHPIPLGRSCNGTVLSCRTLPLVIFDHSTRYIPRPVEHLSGIVIKFITCGSYHTAAVTENGHCLLSCLSLCLLSLSFVFVFCLCLCLLSFVFVCLCFCLYFCLCLCL
jgi:hypothetical protein